MVGCWHGYLSGARCKLAYGPADATATHCLLLSEKSRLFLPFWYRLTRVVPDKGPLNGCVCVYLFVHQVSCLCACVCLVHLFVEFDAFWAAERPADIMQFNVVRDKFVTGVSDLLQQPTAQLVPPSEHDDDP